MNQTKIDWADYTWNPITGCLHKCPYCYARRLAERFRGSKSWPDGFAPTWHQDRLFEPADMKNPAVVFVGSMADVFGAWVPDVQIQLIIEATKSERKMLPHDFLFLTKNPERMAQYIFPPNCWAGFTATDQAMWDEGMEATHHIAAYRRFVSIEPILGPVTIRAPKGCTLPDWVIVGAMTGPTAGTSAPEQSQVWEWTADIVQQCMKLGIPLLVKRNVDFPSPDNGTLSIFANRPKEEVARYPDPLKRAVMRVRELMEGTTDA